MKDIPLGIYRHYKGHDYQVIGFALHTETHERLVLYKPLYTDPKMEAECGQDPTFARPYDMFTEMIMVDDKEIPRFTFVDAV